jgi:hypothetical protein
MSFDRLRACEFIALAGWGDSDTFPHLATRARAQHPALPAIGWLRGNTQTVSNNRGWLRQGLSVAGGKPEQARKCQKGWRSARHL